MQPWDAYLLHNALKLHFTTDSYDAIKYNYKTSARQKSFLLRKDRFFFARLAKQYPSKQQVIDFLVANFTRHGTIHTFSQDKIYEETYTEWLRRMDALAYYFSEDMDRLVVHCEKNGLSFDDLFRPSGNVVPIVNLWSSNEISLESIVILNHLTNFMAHANKLVSETIFWPEFYRKVYKYGPFVKVDLKKFRGIVLSKFTS